MDSTSKSGTIENMLNAIQSGIFTSSTKQRLSPLEEQKEQLEHQILQERIQNPILSLDQINCFLEQYKNTDTHNEIQRQRLIDSFANSVYVYDDRIVLMFNYKDGTKTITLNEIKSSDLAALSPPESA